MMAASTRGGHMNRRSLGAALAAGFLVLGWPPVQALAASAPILRVVASANAFLASLDDAQRKKVLYAFDDAGQRARWSNLPVTIVERGGISLKDLSAAQKSAAMKLLASVLSPAGFEKVQQIMEGDEV